MPTTSITAVSALQFLPAKISINAPRSGPKLSRLPAGQRCQTVFGEGRRSARALLVGEQPGHDEDLQGQPFVGPAGRVLDEGLEAAGISRAETYVTNVVKHFKWIPKGKRRIHKKPSAREIAACLPWLEKEIDVIKPQVLVCLGATAAQALLGRDFKVSVQRGQVISTAAGSTRSGHGASFFHFATAERPRASPRNGSLHC
jgi:uracil-DNA glycosylase